MIALIAFLLVASPYTQAEMEFAQILKCGEKPITPLSEALTDLAADVIADAFGEDFFASLRKLEKEKFSGEIREEWENGQTRFTASFIGGMPDGHVHGWYKDGREAFKAFFYEGKKVGIHIAFYPSSMTKYLSNAFARLLVYSDQGKLYGKQYTYDKKGDLAVYANFKKGKLHGIKGLCGENSTLEALYKNGKFKKQEERSHN